MQNSVSSIHLGRLIEKILEEKHLSRAYLARQLNMSPQNIRKNILEKESLSTDKIQRINAILDCNLFDYFTTPSDRSITIKDCDSSQIAAHDFYNQSGANEIAGLKKQIEILEARLADKDTMIEWLKKSLEKYSRE